MCSSGRSVETAPQVQGGGVRRLTVLCCRVLSAEEAAAGVDLMREVAEAELEFLGLIIFRNEPKVIYDVLLELA